MATCPANSSSSRRGNDPDEDAGWLLGLVINTVDQTTDLVVLDAGHFDSAPVGRVRLPHRIPPGFHGNWFPDS